jgi:hypothetical protein
MVVCPRKVSHCTAAAGSVTSERVSAEQRGVEVVIILLVALPRQEVPVVGGKLVAIRRQAKSMNKKIFHIPAAGVVANYQQIAEKFVVIVGSAPKRLYSLALRLCF